MDKTIQQWQAAYPLLKAIMNYEEVAWDAGGLPTADTVMHPVATGMASARDAEARLERFRPLIQRLFPETAVSQGLIESELRDIPAMAGAMGLKGRLLIKLDSELPVAGSVKARGGIYEILKLAETIAVRDGGFQTDGDYRQLAEESYRSLYSTWEVVVGSTGNLGLSIGIMSAALGFQVTVHMSAEAKQWKKDKLRSYGVTVVEYPEDYSKAVEEGRRQAEANPRAHFVDDENSMDLFWGYSVAAFRLQGQLNKLGIVPTADRPVDVYLPCGVGGAPGGICFGLKLLYGDAVRCWFVEPTHAPCMLLGLMTGEHDRVSVQDFGLDGRTEADGLAVGRASRLAGRMVENLVSGVLTVDDSRLVPWVRQLYNLEGIFIEPSAASAFIGPVMRPDACCSILWATGGRLVPETVRQDLLNSGPVGR